MSRYSSYGKNDSQLLSEQDTGFTGFNTRVRPDILNPTILADSRNGRMSLNGEWQVRKGIDIVSDVLVSGVSGITLPFVLNDASPPVLADSAEPRIWGSCAYSDPESPESQYIIIALNDGASIINSATGETSTLDYPTGYALSRTVSLIQAFDKVILFNKGSVALSWDGDFANGFEKVESGQFVQPTILSGNHFTSLNGKITGNLTNSYGIGDEIEIIENDGIPELPIGSKYLISETTVNDFCFYANVPDHSNVHLAVAKTITSGIGYHHMPAPEFGVYQSNRLIVPKAYEVDNATESYTPNGNADEIIFSQSLDINTYDNLGAQYRLNSGSADYIVGLMPFFDNQLVVFNRNSIMLISGTNDPVNGKTSIVTTEVGCVARDSIVQVGSNVFFLSDNGVYGASFQDLYNLRGNNSPLSEPIDKTISEINRDIWDKSTAVYFDNKYYIAVPLNKYNENGELVRATGNNAILIFNFINKQWESIDTIDDPRFDIQNLIISGNGDSRAVFLVNSLGGVHKVESRLDGVDRIALVDETKSIDVSGTMVTRQYNVDSLDRKKWNSYEMFIESSPERSSNFNISAETENLDYNVNLGTLADANGGDLPAGEDVSIRGRIGNTRAYGIQLKISNTTGRPRIKTVKVSGVDSFKSTNKAI
jgi:hypothetical protein